MTARRLFGLLTMFVMLHLTLVGADNVCAGHGHDMNAAHTQAGVLGHQMSKDAMARGEAPRPCETPSTRTMRARLRA